MDRQDLDLIAEVVAARVQEKLEPQFTPLRDNPRRIQELEDAHKEQKIAAKEQRQATTKLWRGLIIACASGILGILASLVSNHWVH